MTRVVLLALRLRRQFSRTPNFDRKLARAKERATARAARLLEPVFILRGSTGLLTLTEREAEAAGLIDGPPPLAVIDPNHP